MKHLDLFSGIGGFALAAQWCGIETVAFCEIDPHACKVLNKNFPNITIHNDVRRRNEFIQYRGQVDLITGGYPCQPFSVAGKQRGQEDDRHLWPAMLEIIKTVRPTWVLAENVAGHIKLGLDEVLSDLEGEGYTARPIIVPACAVNAPHRRDRVWILGYTEHNGRNGSENSKSTKQRSDGNEERKEKPGEFTRSSNTREENAIANVTHTDSQRRRSRNPKRKNAKNVGQLSRSERRIPCGMEQWDTEPGVGRVANGIPDKVAKLRGLGNAIVPQVAYEIMQAILKHHES